MLSWNESSGSSVLTEKGLYGGDATVQLPVQAGNWAQLSPMLQLQDGTNNQVLIYPVYTNPPDTTSVLDIRFAADEYVAFLTDLAKSDSETVGAALAALNQRTASDIANFHPQEEVDNPDGTKGFIPEVWSWTAYGNTNLTFNPPLPAPH